MKRGYLMWKQTTEQKGNLKIFKEEIEDFLPEKILDFHTHICSKDTVPSGVEYATNAGGNKLKEYTMDELKEDIRNLYPGRDSYAVCFGMANKKFNVQIAYTNNNTPPPPIIKYHQIVRLYLSYSGISHSARISLFNCSSSVIFFNLIC